MPLNELIAVSLGDDADMPTFQHACCKTMKVYIFDLASRGVVFAVTGDALGIEDAGGAWCSSGWM